MSSKSSTTRQLKSPLHHLKSKKWCFPSTAVQSTPSSTSMASTSSGPSISPSKSPEPNCAICLGKIDDKSFSDRCFHCFCRLCLFEWAKVKAECPVCRQAFNKIIYNIRAMDDYDEHVVEPHIQYPSSPFMTYANEDGQRFRYPTTLTPLRRRMRDFERRLQYQMSYDHEYRHHVTPVLPANFVDFIRDYRRSRDNLMTSGERLASASRLTAQHMVRRHALTPAFFRNPFEHDIFPPPAGTSAHRRYVYDSDLWVLTNGDGDISRSREVSFEFFSSNPACTHRLIPWLNRELNAILQNPNETETLTPRILNALLMYNITSVGFKKLIAPFTLMKTNHFIHEFYNFARSPYDMEQYSRISIYVPRHRATIVESEPLPPHLERLYGIAPQSYSSSSDSDSSTSDSSIEIISNSPVRDIPTVRPLFGDSPRVYSVNDTNSDVSSTEIEQLLTPSPVETPSLRDQNVSLNNTNSELSPTLNPTPIPRGDLPDVNFGNIDIIDDFDNPKPGTSGIKLRNTAQTKWSDSDSTDVDVGHELEAAIARFEQKEDKSPLNCEVKKEIKTETTNHDSNALNLDLNHNKEDDTQSDSSVLIVGYKKPLHERTPEFIDLGSDSEPLNDNESKLNELISNKKDKKGKHRKRLKSVVRSPSPHSHNKRKCKHKSRERTKDKYKDKYKHKLFRYAKHSRSKSSSSSSSSESSSDQFKHLSDSLKKKHFRHKHKRHHSKHSRHSSRDDRYDINSSTPLERKPNTSRITSTSLPSSLGSIVIRKTPIETETYKVKHYYIYSDTD